ncbi:hypothetical protein COV05_03865 [Candidatus Uhrbacteria bacterium CG10_big_fil_rev_8_21_14_0_10_48_16]|uniref:Uncharacterized protein n=1 Tax=Candidatus Uhrbacteria bacterium CG10_big_fil_rev_8_21_14_0_10_48_16 TaxID=1975038 RepID=A0A2M8LGB0_9BACT|nr:MAG: hypothetical protein COV05_03865 [Candidatus Uhrbacteria bacterium CG10_big_fil_rev_8_21_14_0_10_48_16]
MIAEVYPLLRLPRNKHVFDYLVPETLTLQRGNLVRIPYRHKELWGVVRAVKDKPPRGMTLKTVTSVHEQMKLREEELSFFEHLALDLAQSVASILNASLPTPPKRLTKRVPPTLAWLPLTLPSSEAQHALRIVHTIANRGKAFIQTPDLRRSAAIILGYLQNHQEQKILILAPTVRDVSLLKSHLTGLQPLIITGEESNNERYRAWQEFRESSEGILLGTRTALLSIDSSITTIFLLRSGDRNHKQWDRNPRYDARELVWQHHAQFSSNVFCLDVAPQPATLTQFNDAERLNWGTYPSVQVVNMNQEKFATKHQSVSYSVGSAIETALSQNKQVLCVYNKKGAYDLRCQDCSHRFLCSKCATPLTAFSHTLECARCRHKEPLALRCPQCHSANLGSFGQGNRDLAQELSQLFPSASVAIIDKEHPAPQTSDILVVTSFYYEAQYDPFKSSRMGLVVHMDVDSPLYNAKPTAVEDLLRDIWQWSWVGFGKRAPVLLQTASPDLVMDAIESPFKSAQEELDARIRYHLPPVYRWCRIVYKEDERRKAEIAMGQLTDQIAHIPQAIIYPLGWNAKGHAYVECGVPAEQFSILLSIFTTLPDRYIIDTNTLT